MNRRGFFSAIACAVLAGVAIPRERIIVAPPPFRPGCQVCSSTGRYCGKFFCPETERQYRTGRLLPQVGGIVFEMQHDYNERIMETAIASFSTRATSGLAQRLGWNAADQLADGGN